MSVAADVQRGDVRKLSHISPMSQLIPRTPDCGHTTRPKCDGLNVFAVRVVGVSPHHR